MISFSKGHAVDAQIRFTWGRRTHEDHRNKPLALGSVGAKSHGRFLVEIVFDGALSGLRGAWSRCVEEREKFGRVFKAGEWSCSHFKVSRLLSHLTRQLYFSTETVDIRIAKQSQTTLLFSVEDWLRFQLIQRFLPGCKGLFVRIRNTAIKADNVSNDVGGLGDRPQLWRSACSA